MYLKQLRLEKNLSQAQLAQKLNISQRTYSNYENQTTQPDIATLIKIADFYGVTLDYLVGRPFANDAGYLNTPEKDLLSIFREVDEREQYKILGAVTALVGKK